jgi:hypothetical protein
MSEIFPNLPPLKKREIRGERALQHLNSNILCAIRIRKTGPKPRYHDLVEVCILPINSDWQASTVIVPFYMSIQPKRKENIDPDECPLSREKITNICLNGVDAYDAAERFDEWVEKLYLRTRKQISLLCHEWYSDREFLIDWLGFESFNQHFDPRVRDLEISANYANDKADFHAEPAVYPKVNLQYLCSNLNVPSQRDRDLLEETLSLIELYKRMLRNLF